jgi:putative transposase
MRKAFKYRVYLTIGQRRILEQQLEECRWVYNETLAYRKRAYEAEQRSANWYETKRLLPFWKADRPGLKLVHSMVLQNVTERVDLAFRSYFRRVREGAQEVGYPRFKSVGRYDSITPAVWERCADRRRSTDTQQDRRGQTGAASAQRGHT